MDRKAIVDCGGLPLLVGLLRVNQATPSVTEQAALCLARMAGRGSNAVRGSIVAAGAAPALVSLLKSPTSNLAGYAAEVTKKPMDICFCMCDVVCGLERLNLGIHSVNAYCLNER